MVLLAVEFEGFTQLGLAGQPLHVSRIGELLAVERTAVDGGGHSLLFKGVLGLGTTEGNVGPNNSGFVLEDHREVFEEVGKTAHLEIVAGLIGEGDMAEPAGGKAVAVDHGADPEQAAFGRAVAHVVVEGELLGDRSPGLFLGGTVVEGCLNAPIDFGLEVALVPLVAGRAEQFDRRGRGAIPHGAGHDEGRKEHRGDGTGQHGFDVAHSQGLVEALRRSGGDVKDAGDDADDPGGDVVGHDAARIEGVKSFRSPGGLHLFQVPGNPVGVGDPHARAEHASEVEGAEAEAAEASQQEVNAENLGEVKGRFAGAGVLPDLQIPVGPVPDGSEEQESTENDVGGGNALEAPEAWIHTGFTGDAPAPPAASHTKAGHERHDKHALPPHRVEDGVGRVKNGEFIQRHGAGPAGYQSGMHEVHGEQAARVVDHDRVHPVPGQSHGGQVWVWSRS